MKIDLTNRSSHSSSDFLTQASHSIGHSSTSFLPTIQVFPLPKVDAFHAFQSPVLKESIPEDGALRPVRGSISLYSRQNLGMLAHEAGGGLVYGCIGGVIYAVLNNYLHMSAMLVATATALVSFPRSLRVFFCMLSDTTPIFGYRRRPYIVLGWLMTGISCLLMELLPLGDPYYSDQAIANLNVSTLTNEQLATIDISAPDRGVKLIILMKIANLGTVLGYSAYSGVLVDLSQQEPAEIRGTAMGDGMVWNSSLSLVSAFFTGLGLNSAAYGGTFSWSVGFNGIMACCAAMSFVVLPLTWFCIQEDKFVASLSKSVFVYLYDLVQIPVVYRFVAFRFFYIVLALYSVTAEKSIQSTWAKVEPVNNGIAAMLAAIAALMSTWAVKKFGLGWNWRHLIIGAEVLIVVLDLIPTFLTIWDVVRSQWFWLGVPLMENIPYAATRYVGALFAFEIETDGFDATLFGLAVTAQQVGTPFGTVLSKNVNSYLDIEREYIEKDDHHARSQATIAYVIAYAINVVAVVFVLLIPRQKEHLHQLQRKGVKSKLWGTATLAVLSFALVWSLMTNILSLFDSTKCLRIAGGSGC